MKVTVTLDSSAWIEYFAGSAKGEKIKAVVESLEEICTSALSLLEIKAKYAREEKPFEATIGFLQKRSRIVSLTDELALKAADFKAKGLHTSDSIIYATAQATHSLLLTCDAHFKNFENVEML